MGAAGLTLPFAPPSAEAGAALLLEQEEWRKSVGVLTRINAIRYIDMRTYARSAESAAQDVPLMDCGLSDGGLVIRVRAYPVRDVALRLAASIGDLDEPRREDIEEEATLHYTLTTEAALSHPASRVLSATWLAGPYNVDGAKIAPPPLAVDGRVLRVIGDAVYGSVQVKTAVRRWTYRLVVDWAEAVESLTAGWGEYVVAWPDGGAPVALELTAPPGAAEMAASGRPCGFSFRVRPADAPWPPKADPANKYVTCDYCKLECDDGYRP